jgi:hypothetical protein
MSTEQDKSTIPDLDQAWKNEGISWNTAPKDAKEGLPPPPNRDDFDSDDTYDEAFDSWNHRIAPIMVKRSTAILRSNNVGESISP